MSENLEENLIDPRDDPKFWDHVTHGSYRDVSVIDHWLPYVLLLFGAVVCLAGLIYLLLYYPALQSFYFRAATYFGIGVFPALMVVLFVAYPDRDMINRSRIERAFDGEFNARNAVELREQIKSKSLSEASSAARASRTVVD